MPISATDLNKAYLAYFGRPADFTGKTYFATLEQADVIKAFDASAESKALYGDNVAAKVNAIYNNLFNRDAEPAGLTYWTTLINQGRITAAGAALAILNGAQGTDKTSVDNKLAASDAFVAALDTTAELVGYSGTDAAASARNWLKGVSSDAASLTAAVAGAQAAVTAAVAVGTGEGGGGFQLTNGTDVASSNVFTAGLVYTPGGDDRINSLQDEDRLTGTGTNATLNATLGNANDNGATMVTPTLNNIKTINVAFTGSGNATNALDLQDATGVDAVNITRISTGFGAIAQNITTAASQLSISNSNSPLGNGVGITFLGTALAGNADSTTLTLKNVNVSGIRLQQHGAVNTDPVAEGFETINLVSTGSANTVGALRAEDLQTLNISGKQNLNLGGRGVTLGAQGAEAARYGDFFRNADGSLTKIDASAFEGNLDLTLGSVFNAGADNTSGVNVKFELTGGKGDDTIRLTQGTVIGGTAATLDKINGGEGNNTLVLLGTSTINAAGTAAAPVANVTNIQALEVRTGHDDLLGADAAVVNADAFDKLATIYVRNEGQTLNAGADGVFGTTDDFWQSGAEVMTATLNNLTAAQASAITIAHGTTGNSNIVNNLLTANLKDATGAADTVAVTVRDGTNNDPRFNFVLGTNADLPATAAVEAVENITITDSDTESNTVALASIASHTGTVSLKGGAATQYFNFDTTTAGGNGGLYGYAVDGSAPAALTGVLEQSATAGQVKFIGSTFDASTYAGNVVVRVDTNRNAAGVESATGGQTIKTGAGNDTVIFDKVNDTRAGLTISDTVSGGDGADTLVIDGQGVRVTLGASEWTNVTGFETIRLIGNGSAALSTRLGQNSYNLSLTNELVANNGVGGLIAIVNDNDSLNDGANALDTVGTAVESGVTIDARALNANMHFSYNGEEGGSATADRFVFADANINGANIIDGGAANNVVLGAAVTNADVIEVRNSAVVSVGDLANIKNVGTLAFTNDQAVAQSAVLELNDTVLDALVDSYHVASTTERETITVRTNDLVNDLPGAIANTALDLDVSSVSGKFVLNVALGQIGVTVAEDNIKLGTGGALTAVTGFNTLLAGDNITVSASQFGLNAAAVGTTVAASGNGVIFGALNSGAATDRLYIVEGAAIAGFGGAGNDIGIYYDADGSGAGAAVLIGVLVDNAGSLAGALNAGITVVA